MPFLSLDRVVPQAIRWLWPGRLPLGLLTMLDGDPGLGKSLVTMDLCARLSTGRCLPDGLFPDGLPRGEPVAVLVLNAEDGSRDTIPNRLRAAGADLGRVHVHDRAPGEPMLRLPGQVKDLDAAVAQSGARLIVIDPLLAFLDAGVNVASDPSVRAALTPLADIARRRECAILLVRHLNKTRGKNALYRGLCSIGFIASCRSSWLVARNPHRGDHFLLAQVKNNLDAPRPSLSYAIEPSATGEPRIVWHGPTPFTDADLLAAPPSASRRRRAESFLLNFLKEGPRSTREIWAAARPLRITRNTLDRARRHLDIATTRVHAGTPQQANYWLLPGQPFTAAICDLPELAEHLRRQEGREEELATDEHR